MQTLKDDEIKEFTQGDFETLSDKLRGKMESGEVDGGVIAKMPEVGKEVAINGIKFFVQTITKSGNIVLEPKGKQ